MRTLRRRFAGLALGLLALAAAPVARAAEPVPAALGTPPVLAAGETDLGPWAALESRLATLDPDPAPLALANPYVQPGELGVRIGGGTAKQPSAKKAAAPRRARRGSLVQLTPERAQALIRSLTVPGWGQATLGHRTAGTVFGLVESGIWGTFAAFRIQERLRSDASMRTASLFAGVDLRHQDEEFRRIVGAFASSDEYNQLVVARDAANQFYDKPEEYREYIAKHSLSGALAWSWQDESSFLRYQAQRKDAHRAALRANTALACAVGNRILSVLHAARVAGKKAAPAAPPAQTWNLEVIPVGGDDPTAYRLALRTRF